MTVKAERTRQRGGRARRLISLLMAIVLTAGLLPAPAAMAENADKPKAEQDAVVELMDAWYQPYVDKLAGWGVMKGDGNGNMRPEDSITRAEYCAMVNRAYGYKVVVPTKFTDVHVSDWFYEDIGIAYGAGYFKGGGGGKAYPNDTLTREEAAVIMARNMRLQPVPGESTSFTDGHDLSSWSKGYVEAIAREGIISGYSDGSFRPDKSITRAEMATMLARAINNLVKTPGEQSLGSVYGNLTINTSGVTLKDTVIAGDLYLTGGVGLGAVTLENVTVLGKIVVSGAGEANQGDSSVILRNTNAQELILDSIANNFVTLRTEGVGIIDRAEVRTKAFIDDVCPSDRGIKLIDVKGKEGLEVQLAGNIKEAVDYTPYSKLILTQGRAETVTIDEEATGATMEIALGATVNTLNLDTGATVTGKGDVNRLNVNASGCIVEMLPDYITIRPGITAIIAGETMDTTTAMESSASPRILAGYPAMKNVAPTSATSVFQTNKKGTVYWALTAIADGSVTEEDLINPPVYGGAIIQSGHMEMPASNTDQTIPLTNLLKDGSYYVSAVLVDNRDLRSPVKVAAFTTPDDSTPDFATDPKLIGLTHERASVTVMPTKSCQLYYAVLPKGAVAPTIDEFKAGAVSGNLGYGSMSVVKNTSSTFQVSDSLEELKDYVLYLLLIDADGSKNSGIKTIDFTTPDGTPPYFVSELTTKKPEKESISFNATVNEDATIYYVVVPVGEQYPVPQPGQSSTDPASDYAKIQVENGVGSGKIVTAGSVKATGNKQVDINIKGLKEATSYDIYYLAKDTAGNYSAEVKMKNENTLDNTPPTVTQDFTRTSGSQPLANTDIKLIFSENISFIDKGVSDDLRTMYNNYADGKMDETQKGEFIKLLKGNFVLIDENSTMGDSPVPTVGEATANSSAWVDYSKVEVTLEKGKTIVTFPGGGEKGTSAVKLASGGNYHFELFDICDTSSNRNEMESPYVMPSFVVAFAQVRLTEGVDHDGDPINPNSKAKKNNSTNEVRADMKFTMSPNSTSSVADSKYYDIFLWTEMSVDFELYARVYNQEGEIVSDKENMSMIGASNSTPNGNDYKNWIYLGTSNIIANPGEKGSMSVNKLIRGKGADDVFSRVNSLKEGYKYEFAISVIKVGGSDQYDTWSENVKVWVTIAAGDNSFVAGVSSGMGSTSAWSQWQTNLGNGRISSIGYSIRNTDDFFVSRQFNDTKVPAFQGGTPKFEKGDQLVEMNLMLDRSGTVFYIVAPVSDGGDPTYRTEFAEKLNNDGTGSGTLYSYTDVPESGTETGNVALSQKIVKTPSENDVHQYVTENVNKPQGDIKCGTASVGAATEKVTVDGLTPNTKYIVYFVTQGTYQSLSPVHCFKFSTGNVPVPLLSVRATVPVVYVKADANADGAWILFTQEQISSSNPTVNMNSKFFTGTNYDSTKYDVKEGSNGAVTVTPKSGTTGTTYTPEFGKKTEYTIIDALIQVDEKTKRSVFDVYASDILKKDLKSMVLGEGQLWEQVRDTEKLNEENKNELKKDVEVTKNSYVERMSQGVPYCFVIAVKNKLGSDLGSNYTFKAVSNLVRSDAQAPKIVSFRATFEVLEKNPDKPDEWIPALGWQGASKERFEKFKFNAVITILFDEPIYIKPASGEGDTVLVTTDKLKAIDKDRIISPAGADLDPAKTSVSGNTIQISLENIQYGAVVSLFNSGYVSDRNGNNNEPVQGSSTGHTGDGYLTMDFESGFGNINYARFVGYYAGETYYSDARPKN